MLGSAYCPLYIFKIAYVLTSRNFYSFCTINPRYSKPCTHTHTHAHARTRTHAHTHTHYIHLIYTHHNHQHNYCGSAATARLHCKYQSVVAIIRHCRRNSKQTTENILSIRKYTDIRKLQINPNHPGHRYAGKARAYKYNYYVQIQDPTWWKALAKLTLKLQLTIRLGSNLACKIGEAIMAARASSSLCQLQQQQQQQHLMGGRVGQPTCNARRKRSRSTVHAHPYHRTHACTPLTWA